MGALCVPMMLSLLFSGLPGHQAEGRHEQVNSLVVERVDIRGNRRLSEKEIKPYIGTRRGRRFDLSQVDRDLRALYATGHFEDVRAFAEDGDRGGKIVTFECREWPLITNVSYEGLGEEMESTLRAELYMRGLDIPSGSEYHPERANDITKAIKRFLAANNHSAANVTPWIEKVSNYEIALTFKIE